jgi:hypothetical protein
LELQEFRLRASVLDNVRATLGMVEESFKAWQREMLHSKGLTGSFQVMGKTGEILGRPNGIGKTGG